MSTLNRVFMITNLLFFAFVLGYLSSPPVEAAGSKTISACANKSNGSMRLGTKCTKLENLITWNQSGIQGPRGASGNNASINTKQVTIRYIGDGLDTFSPCGAGTPGLYLDDQYTFNGYRFNDTYLNNELAWTRHPTCSITLNVIN
jgi:hypothetical protein